MGSSGGWGSSVKGTSGKFLKTLKYSNHRYFLVLFALFADGSNCNGVCIERKGKAGMNCMQMAPLWLVTLFPYLVSSSVCTGYTPGGEESQRGARVMGRGDPK